MSDTCQHGPGSIVSPQSPGERKKPHLIQMPPRTFSHRSSSHVITLTRIWAPITGPCIYTPPIFAANGILFVRLGGSNRKLPCSVLFVRGSLPSLAFGLPEFFGRET
jgi:hypothetical protein